MAFFKDDPDVKHASLQPAKQVTPLAGSSSLARSLAQTYNRIGGLLSQLAREVDVPVEATLAVWQIESGGTPAEPGRPILRLENHKFFEHWGKQNADVFDGHFQFGGRKGIEGKAWTHHKFRPRIDESWRTFHGDQSKEYEVFDFAGSLGGVEAACLSSSFGGPQILGSNHERLGYAAAETLFRAFQESERWQVAGFFDFCVSGKLVDEIKDQKWVEFAAGYNGKGQAEAYGSKISEAFEAALELDIAAAAEAAESVTRAVAGMAFGIAPTDIQPSDELAEFVAFITALGLKNFKPYELLVMGHQHSDPQSPAFGLNHQPPRELWPNIVPTIRVLDRLRDLLAAPIQIISAYRSPAYNERIAGATKSQHVEFCALDFIAKSISGSADWAATLRQMRNSGLFKGGIGTYPSFVHVDTRGTNADW